MVAIKNLCLASAAASGALSAVLPQTEFVTIKRDDNTDWNMKLEVGSSKFHIGDAKSQDFKDLYMKTVCGPNGCDGGSPKDFEYQDESAGVATKGKGTITMTGNAPDDQGMVDAMLGQIANALVASSDCSTSHAQKCMGPNKRETGPQALNCGDVEFASCNVVNYIEATMYDPAKDEKAQIRFSASSKEPNPFSCGAVIGTIAGALTAFEFPAMAQGAAGIANAVCAGATAPA